MPRHLFSVVYNLTDKNLVQKSGIINSLLDVLECSVPEYFYSATRKNTYMLFTGREVRIGKNCARGLEYGLRPQAEGRTRDRGHSFSQYGPTKAGE